MCLSMFSCFIEFLPYFCLVTIPLIGSFCGVEVILRISLLLYLYVTLTNYIPQFLSFLMPYISVGLLTMLVMYVPTTVIPYWIVWLYEKLLWVSDPALQMVEIVLALNLIMYFSRSCAEKIEEAEETDVWKWKLLLTIFSASCYALVAALMYIVYAEGSNAQFWLLLLVVCLSMMLAAHNMMWMSHIGIVSDVAFVTLCSVVVLYTMKEEATLIHSPLPKPYSWYSMGKSGSMLQVSDKIIHTSIETAKVALTFLRRFISPWFVMLLLIRLYSILFLIQRVLKNFGFENEESFIENFEEESSLWKSSFVVKCSIIFMMTQSSTRLLYQSSGNFGFSTPILSMLNEIWPQDVLFGRCLQIIVVNCFYIWRLYWADDWPWTEWFSA